MNLDHSHLVEASLNVRANRRICQLSLNKSVHHQRMCYA